MMLQSKNPTCSNITGEELLDAMSSTDTYTHLKIFMGYNPGVGALPQQYLMVTPSCFGLVILLDVDFCNGEIVLTLQDNVTKSVSKISLNVDDKNIKLQFINWNDIKKLINDDINCLENENGSLLESES